ncbi:MAG TPA: hypothetical protein VGM90_36050 [Kofleriaceae bacterium]|jgi:hypothetical protein
MKRFAVLALFAACGHAGDKPAEGGSAVNVVAVMAASPPPLTLTARIELKAAGKEPRQVLAYNPKVASRELCFTQGMVDTHANVKLETKEMLEGSKNNVCITWKNTAVDRLAYTFKISKVFIGAAHLGEDQMSVGEKATIGAIEKGILASPEGTAKIDVQGRIALSAPGIATQPSAPVLLWSYAIPFPAEAIGPGGTWHVRDVVPEENVPTDADYTLVSFTDGHAVVHWKRTMKTKDATAEGEGEATVALDDPEAVTASEDDTVKLELGGAADQAPPMKLHTSL